MPNDMNFQVETGLSPPRKLAIPTHVLSTSDIPGAMSKGARKEIKRPDGWDISGSTSMRLIPEHVSRRNDMSLNVSDIGRTSPKTTFFNTTGGSMRSCNPLTPVYSTPSYTMRPHTPPRQLTLTNKVNDIPGTAPTPLHTFKQRDTMKVSDIDRAAPRSKIGTRTPGLCLVTKDINGDKDGNTGFRTDRSTNPLSPRYKIASPPAGQAHYLDMGGENHPRKLHKGRQNAPIDLSLTSNDIPGGSATSSMPFPKERRQIRNPCDVSDMPFASPCKRQAVLKPSGRETNPVAPCYKPLDHKSYLPPMALRRSTTQTA
eukprot:TRINITY_DN17247_c0_g1_i1.p1 TRINITY_DN17247_c0_g1~~TRINITY_DN17247_c0_g1_i1.p1  ORF type:complete len:315 (+),score=99.05 TRINITY_DN17247_c0_g1_i1:70-1014(+)